MNDVKSDEKVKRVVRQTYGNIARRFVEEPAQASCCGPSTDSECGPDQPASCCGPSETACEITDAAARFYSTEELGGLPDSVTGASLGCGNPTAIAELKPGEVVLDLGSGGGIDCFLAAKKVGPEGHVIGLDMTPDMIKLARRNAKKVEVTNVEFRYGEMEDMPLPEESVDVIISNCVINLSPDKGRVFDEAYRVLRPGGRMSVSDIVIHGELPRSIRDRLDAWASCLAGALDESDYLSKIRAAGFEEVAVLSRDYVMIGEAAEWEEAQVLLAEAGLSPHDLDHKVASIKVKARKPA
ncbi:MAG: arsenite methyltransferase [Chloroflexi bacterium]|nr:arsenite methyltransferase [Chloroflexota bacterium]